MTKLFLRSPKNLAGFAGSGTYFDYQGKSNDHQKVGGTGKLQKFNNTKVIDHNNLSSILPAKYMATIAKSGADVNKTTSSMVDLTPNIPGKTTIEPSQAAAKLDKTAEMTFSWPEVNEKPMNTQFTITKLSSEDKPAPTGFFVEIVP